MIHAALPSAGAEVISVTAGTDDRVSGKIFATAGHPDKPESPEPASSLDSSYGTSVDPPSAKTNRRSPATDFDIKKKEDSTMTINRTSGRNPAMAIVRFNPANELFNLQREMNRLFTDFFPTQRKGEEFESGVWRPMVDIHEDENSYLIDAELPGLRREDVKINFQDGVLTISGERRYEREGKGENGNSDGEGKKGGTVHRMERLYGKFYRTFSFPSTINADAIKAKFEDGVLKVTVPKAEEVKPRQIEIQ
jgi:HSP20 family protein